MHETSPDVFSSETWPLYRESFFNTTGKEQGALEISSRTKGRKKTFV